MKSKNLGLIVILGALLVFGGCACSGYNGLIQQDENVRKTWNNVQSEYQRRNDLIPNLVKKANPFFFANRTDHGRFFNQVIKVGEHGIIEAGILCANKIKYTMVEKSYAFIIQLR